jgi:hypothetical protein
MRIAFRMDDMLRAASATSAAIERSPTSYSQELSPFFIAYGMSMYKYYEQQPSKAARFAQAMRSWSQRRCSTFIALTSHVVIDLNSGSTDIGASRYFSLGVPERWKDCGYWGRERPHFDRTCACEFGFSSDASWVLIASISDSSPCDLWYRISLRRCSRRLNKRSRI